MTISAAALRPLFIVIYPYKFHDFNYSLLELEEIKRYCDVEVWDLSRFTTPAFRGALSAPGSASDDVFVLSSLSDFVKRLRGVRERAVSSKVCIVNELTSNSVIEVICNQLLGRFASGTGIAVLDLYNGGVPIRVRGAGRAGGRSEGQPGVVARMLRVAGNLSGFAEAAKTSKTILLSLLARRLRQVTTHRLVAGRDWVALADEHRRGNNRIEFVPGHSHDYSNHLLYRLRFPEPVVKAEKFAVMLDGAGPAFGSDAALLRRKVYFTADVWYPALSRFFDQLEAGTGVTVEIAGHYKTTHPPIAPIFGNRRVYYHRTIEMVRNCEFVITRASTAISHAVVSRKPIIFIYSNQLAEDRLAMRGARAMAGMLGNELVNVDVAPVDPQCLLRVDEGRYRAYEDACLTSARGAGPNCDIILENVMGIPVPPRTSRSTMLPE